MEFRENEDLCVSRATKQIKVINNFFIKIGLYANLKGFNYLLSAVEEVLKLPESIHSLTKVLYPKIAEKYSTTVCGVEKNIRNAIETAYTKGKLQQVANTFYGANFGKYEKPTNGEFIAFLTNIAEVA
ncbi:MAG: hypothetical protein E7360_00140 [Clostridiales bacterium]|nr:hypothetical protein [Clostridiales bacterium]